VRFYEQIPAAELVNQLKVLGRHGRKLLEECVEKQEVTRRKASKAAESLYDAGFLFIRDVPDFFEPSVVLRPSLLGEEALELLENEEEEKEKPGSEEAAGL
jgi:hypothetical protein